MTPRPARLLLTSLVLGLTTSVLGVVPAGGTPAPAVVPAVDDLFTPLSGLSLGGPKVRVKPTDYSAFSVDVRDLRADLAQAPTPATTARGDGASLEVEIPDPSGELQRFAVVETVVGEPGFEARHPEIRTYAGNGLDDTSLSIRMDLTPMGFHASVRDPGGTGAWYVDPAFNARGETRHLSYFGAAVPRSADLFVERDAGDTAAVVAAATAQIGTPDGPVTQKDFRLALVTDPTYAAYFGAANVSAEKATLINRVNHVFMDDLAIQFLLVDDNDLLNLDTAALATEPGGPCGANGCYTPAQLAGGCTSSLLERNVFVTGQIIGADSYDIGHIALGNNGGGAADLATVGGSGKARGCSGLSAPEGDLFAIDYVAHQLGRQMGANPTFNGTQGSCNSTNRNTDTTLVEPGSGSSIMAYAGSCERDDLQPHSDPYFSFVSVEEITDTVTADTNTADEQQVVNLARFDGVDAFTISCDGCPNGANTVTRGAMTYNSLTVADAISAATGEAVIAFEVSDYDPEALVSIPSDNGFTVDFTVSAFETDIPTLIITPTVGDFDTFTGVTVNGGPTTNEGTDVVTANTNPVVTAPADKTIPIRTPFALTGSGTDTDDDPLVYLWEQTDTGSGLGTGLVDNTKPEGPLFRMFGVRADVSQADALQSPAPGINLATASPSRTFPDLAQVLAGNTNAETGTCPAAPAAPAQVPVPTVECFAEFLPTASYDGDPIAPGRQISFRLSARDQQPVGGGYAYDDVELTVDPSAGPFLVTSQASPGTWVLPGSAQTVTWAVNGTAAPELAPDVRISLSLDGGLTFPTELVANTPNDGSQVVTIPAVESAAARIKVEAVDNYFFDVNDAGFAIGVPPETTITEGPASKRFVLTRKTRFSVASTSPGSTYVCTVDGKSIPCAASTRVKFKPGTHVFRAAARSGSGIVDPTPATRVFASPFNDGQLARVTKGWKRVQDKASYRGAYLLTSSKGQVLSRKAKKVSKVALVAHTGPGFGRVVVMLNGKKLRVIDLSSRSLTKKVLIKVTGFRGKRSGTVSIRTLDDKPVRIDGLGLLTKIKK